MKKLLAFAMVLMMLLTCTVSFAETAPLKVALILLYHRTRV